MKRLGPQDSSAIDELISLVKRFGAFPAAFDKPPELMGPRDFLAMSKAVKPFMKDWRRYKGATVADYAARFKSPALREGFGQILGDMPGFSFLALVLMLAWLHERSAGYPLGGSLELARSVARKYEALGGELRLRSRVEKILVDRRRAVGVRLEGGEELRAGLVVSAADGFSTIFRLLGGEFCDRAIRRRYGTWPIFEPLFCLSLGVARDLSGESPLSVRLLREPIMIEGRPMRKIGIKHFCFDPACAPPGKSVVQVMYTSDYDYWKALAPDPDSYRKEKERTVVALLGALEELLPGIRSQVEVVDAATPLTFERCTGNRRGSFEGWMMTPRAMTTRMPKTLPGLSGFRMIGQWVQPGGGLPSSLKSGRDLIAMLCAEEGREFKTRAVSG